MTNKPILFIDCDDTIENFCEIWLEVLNEKFGTNYTVDDVTDWDIAKLFPGNTKSELLFMIDNEAFWKKVKPLPKAQESLLTLSVIYDVYLVTSSTYSTMCYKMNEVLRRYFWFIPENKVICCHNKWLLTGDYLVDDNISNVLIGHTGNKYQGVLFTKPHNMNMNCGAYGIKRVDNWDEALKYFMNELK